MVTATRLLALALALAGCKRQPARCAAGRPAVVEVRDGAGQLALAVKPGEDGALDLCGPRGEPVGAARSRGPAVTVTGAQGALVLELTRDSEQVAHGRGPKGPRLRTYRDDRELRVLTPEGVPLASVSTEDVVIIRDPATRPLATVERRDGDVVIRGTDGATRAYVLAPAVTPAAAAVFGLPGLSLHEQVSLYLLLGSRP